VAAALTNQCEIVVVGSQAIHASVPRPPKVCLLSEEADLYPPAHPELADLIDGTIGEGSPFHERHGYYAQGVGPDTAVLPAKWKERSIKVQGELTEGKVAIFPSLPDLMLSKYVANRPKDLDFNAAILDAGLVRPSDLLERLPELKCDARVIAGIERRLKAAEQALGSGRKVADL